jgi:hypothetical protein
MTGVGVHMMTCSTRVGSGLAQSTHLISVISQRVNTGTPRSACSGHGWQRALNSNNRGTMAFRSKRRLNRYWASAR